MQKVTRECYRYIAQKRKAKESVPPMMGGKGELVTRNIEKSEVPNNFLASVLTGSQAPHCLISMNLKMRAGGAKPFTK